MIEKKLEKQQRQIIRRSKTTKRHLAIFKEDDENPTEYIAQHLNKSKRE